MGRGWVGDVASAEMRVLVDDLNGGKAYSMKLCTGRSIYRR